jgi:hypothetical protein
MVLETVFAPSLFLYSVLRENVFFSGWGDVVGHVLGYLSATPIP